MNNRQHERLTKCRIKIENSYRCLIKQTETKTTHHLAGKRVRFKDSQDMYGAE